MILACLDYESYYDKQYSLSKMTTEEYINDKRFEVIGFSIKFGNEPAQWYTGTHEYLQSVLDSFAWETIALINHNSLFDASVLSFVYGIYAVRYIDTLSMARAVHGIEVGGSLAKLSEHYGVGVKGTEIVQALSKHRKDFTPQELAQYGAYCKNDVELTYKLFFKLLPNFTLSELTIIDTTLKMAIQPTLEIDAPLMKEHLKNVKTRKEELMARVGGLDKKVIMSNPQLAKFLFDCDVDVPMKISPTTGKWTYAFAKTDEEFKALLEHENLLVQAVIAARLGVKSTLEETRTERFIGIAERMDNLIPVPLKYYSTSTGRWAGADSINFQNLTRKSPMRKGIQAPEGFMLVGGDLKQVELRVGLWLAEEFEKLKILGDGLDLYKVFYSDVSGTPIDEITEAQRFIGKTSQLSLIFGVGSDKLRSAIKAGIGLDIGTDEAKRIVDYYRATHPHLRHAWAMCGQAIKKMAYNEHGVLGYNNLLNVEGAQGIRFPSGLYLKYPQLHLSLTESGHQEYKYKLRNGWDKLYSGKLFNNSCQGTARCIMAEAMPRIAKRYRIVLTVHDALYILAPKQEVQEAVDFLTAEMCKVPEWAPGLPLAVECHWGKTLGDC